MTVPISTSRSSYVGNGVTTVFSTGFYFLEQSHVVVKLTLSGGSEVIQLLGVDYTVTDPASVGAVGSITMLVAPPAAAQLVIERTLPYTQPTSLRTQGAFSPSIHEDSFDEGVMIDQQLARRVSDLESAGAAGSVIAGNGLSFSGSTLHVGAGNGIQANADTIEVLYGDAGHLADVSKAAANAGGRMEAARIDHKHDVSTAAPVAGAVLVGNAAAEGVATSLSRSDHVHAIAAPAAPANVTKAAADAGAATSFARSDHKHDVSTANVSTITDAANAEGAANSLARSDHTHSHGNRGGGALHANAVNAGAAGFMTGADKASLDLLTATRSYVQCDNNVAQSIPHNVATTVKFALEKFDTLGEYDPATGIFTATKAGYYLASAQIQMNLVAADAAHVILNLVGPSYSVANDATAGIDDGTAKPRVTALFLLAVGETIKAQVTQTNTPVAARSLTSNQGANCFTVARMV